ncbi:hypothetical protein LCGC14_2454150 [marine sediment metagenome]|uniref:DUF4177 domain-containing protein n=1 Tax=marine sediment metagenome TaxID=412755 RepID=A0A0F9C2T3_9ZZZZ
MIVTATWMRGHEVIWYEWVLVNGTYINKLDGKIDTPKDLLVLAQQKREEGWQLCRRVV